MRSKTVLLASLLYVVSLVVLSAGPGCKGRDKDFFYRKAQWFWDRGMYGLAAEHYEHFASERPEDPRAPESIYKSGFIYAYYLGDYPRAVQLFQRLIALHPESPFTLKAHEDLAESYATRLRQYSLAISEYRKLIALRRGPGRDLSGYLYKIGRCYFMMGNTDQAIESYEAVLRRFPEGEFADRAAYQIGFLCFLREDWKGAEKAFRLLLDTYPDSDWGFDAMVQLAQCLKKQDRSTEAAAVYETARKRFPDRAAGLEPVGGAAPARHSK